LGIYGDSNSDSDEEHVSQHENLQQSSCENDSDEELKVCKVHRIVIKRLKNIGKNYLK
jgi:hypothetical protein